MERKKKSEEFDGVDGVVAKLRPSLREVEEEEEEGGADLLLAAT